MHAPHMPIPMDQQLVRCSAKNSRQQAPPPQVACLGRNCDESGIQAHTSRTPARTGSPKAQGARDTGDTRRHVAPAGSLAPRSHESLLPNALTHCHRGCTCLGACGIHMSRLGYRQTARTLRSRICTRLLRTLPGLPDRVCWACLQRCPLPCLSPCTSHCQRALQQRTAPAVVLPVPRLSGLAGRLDTVTHH